MASSSSCIHNKSFQYDVFLSFSGEDTRKTFIDHLYDALDRQGICTFKDDERLQKGKMINDELLQSIEDSRCYVIVFSKHYASSSWCLNELLKIMECHNTNKQIVFPVFYDVDPSEVRKQSGSVGKALAKHKNEEEVGKWRVALKKAADLSGWDVRKTANGYEAKVIKLIVEQVSLELRYINMDVDKNLVGMEQRVQDFDPCLEIGANDVRMIGIKGMGGAGKTTLAWAIFNKISMNFEGKSFVENVRERASKFGLEKLQEQVLRDVLKDNGINVGGVHEGKNLMKKKLGGKEALVVLDDVDDINQLKMLVGDTSWFKSGSRIIITTRDGQVLEEHKVKWIRDVSLLLEEEAICLFSRHAFGKDIPTQGYEKHSSEVVNYAAGLPLTIKVLGSKLCGKDNSEWTYTLERLKTIPLKETLSKLELSFESLEDDHKNIFLDVACFLRDWEEDDAIKLIEGSGVRARNGLRVLEKKSLLTFKKDFGSLIQMHDHLVEMGKNIVRRDHPFEPNKHSRLWIQEEIEQVLVDNLGSEARCLKLKTTPGIFMEGIGNMKKLKCLIVNHREYNISDNSVEIGWNFPNSLQNLYWYGYPNWCLPKTFEGNNLVALEMPHSNIEQLWEGGKVMKKLKFLDLSGSKLESLDLGLTPNLERLNLDGCYTLVRLEVHGGCLKSLTSINLSRCQSLKSMFFIGQLKSLEVLCMSRLDLKEIPDYIFTGHSNNSLLELDLSWNPIKEIPSSIGNLHKLVSLDLNNCSKLKRLPGSICSLQHLRTLILRRNIIRKLPKDLGPLERLECLDLQSISIKHIPRSIFMLKQLKTLRLNRCDFLEKLLEYVGIREIPNSICELKCLKVLNLQGCRRLEKLPDKLGNLKCLELLDVQGSGITNLPQSIFWLKGLKIHR